MEVKRTTLTTEIEMKDFTRKIQNLFPFTFSSPVTKGQLEKKNIEFLLAVFFSFSSSYLVEDFSGNTSNC